MYYNADGSPFYTKKGICGMEQLVNGRKKVVEEYYFTGENKRGKSTDGYSGVIRKYNKYGTIGIEQYVDEKNRPMMVEQLGYSKLRNTIVNKKYIVATEYLDTEGNRVLNKAGYAVMRNEYENKQLVKVEFFDTDGKTPVNTIGGFAKFTLKMENGKPVVTRPFCPALSFAAQRTFNVA